MPKKNMTEEEKKAWGAKMKAAREAKNATADVAPEPEVREDILSGELADLKRQIEELKQSQFMQPKQRETPQMNSQGSLTGTYEKYTTDPAHYPDPTERLAQEPKLARFAFPLNYELQYTVSESAYETKQGIFNREPKFSVDLVKIMLDEDTGEPTNMRYLVKKVVFHEDPLAAVTVARENGIPVDETNEKEFLDEMRYIRVRDWLLEIFYPKPVTKSQERKEMVIDGKVVQYYEINAPDPQAMPFSDLNTRL